MSPGQAGEATVAVSSTRVDRALEGTYSPDGRKVAFESDRSGPMAVWIANTDGTNPTLLFSGSGYISGSPTWSPDGRSIAFDSRKDGNPELYVSSVDGGAARRLTNHPADDVLPYWSHDGKWIYFASNRSGSFEIYKMPPTGGDPMQLTRKGGWSPRESADGRFVYYSRRMPGNVILSTASKSPLLRIPVEGGEESQVAEGVFDRTWAVSREGIWFLVPVGQQRAELRFLDFATGKTNTAGRIGTPVHTGMAISPDGRTLLYNQLDHSGTEILLVEHFR
jgi:Tol biopolymer transport system component